MTPNEFDSNSDEFDSSFSSSVEEIVSSKGLSKAFLIWYDDETGEDIEEFYFKKPKNKGKCSNSTALPTLKSKGKGSNSTTSKSSASNSPALLTLKIQRTLKNPPKKFIVKSVVPIWNCCIALENKTTWDMILMKSFEVAQ
ncbi:hypothetical protein Tco_1133075 [Tanacetum coccineum]|uniref:Uncharacterized protein n=1 Tax=Tanacetum coccineum TaxID=301880 RepID=A0ABQ5JHQ7_9ASTR